jgi:hypothetical protein
MSAGPESGRLGRSMPRFTHRTVIAIGATARVVVAQRAPETLTLAGTELSRPLRPSPGCP